MAECPPPFLLNSESYPAKLYGTSPEDMPIASPICLSIGPIYKIQRTL
jgi:hypothetical protein